MYFNTARLSSQLKLSKAEGTYVKTIRRIQRQALIILDDFGLQTIDVANSHILLEIVENRYNLGSLIITSQVPVDKWYELIPDKTVADAIMDRIGIRHIASSSKRGGFGSGGGLVMRQLSYPPIISIISGGGAWRLPDTLLRRCCQRETFKRGYYTN